MNQIAEYFDISFVFAVIVVSLCETKIVQSKNRNEQNRNTTTIFN